MGLSVRPHVLSYDRQTQVVADRLELGVDVLFQQSHVRPSDIKAVSTFALLQKRLQDASSTKQKWEETLSKRLQEVVASGNLPEARALLKQGAPVDFVPSFLRASQYVDPPEYEYTSIEANTPLLIAVMRNDVPMARLLLEYGADVHQSDPYGSPLLTYPALKSEVKALLTQYGAKKDSVKP